MEAKKLENVTIAEYLALEKEAQEKYEYHDGYIYSMAGGTYNHGVICGNIFGEVRTGLANKNDNCRALLSEIKLHIQSENSFVYPDTMVICGEVEHSTLESNAVVNPVVVVEVLSKTTATYDRGDKFYLYRQLKSVQEYVLIEQEKPQVELYQRQADLWKISRFKGIDTAFTLSSIMLTIQIRDLYEGVGFSESQNRST